MDKDIKAIQEAKAKELTKLYDGDVSKIYDKETDTIYQWDSNSESYVLEFSDKQL